MQSKGVHGSNWTKFMLKLIPTPIKLGGEKFNSPSTDKEQQFGWIELFTSGIKSIDTN